MSVSEKSESNSPRSGEAEGGRTGVPSASQGGDKALPENTQAEKGERLDEALEETFPSSDPVSVKITK